MADHSNAGASENVQTRKIRPWIAGLLTFFGWGVGLYYARRTKAAIFMSAATVVSGLLLSIGIIIHLYLNGPVTLPAGLSANNIGDYFGLFITIPVAVGVWIFVAKSPLSVERAGPRRLFGYIVIWAAPIVLSVSAALIIRFLFFQPFHIPAASMAPTINRDSYFIVEKNAYGYNKHSFAPFDALLPDGRVGAAAPQRGDVVIFRNAKDGLSTYVKRLVGLPGDEIRFINGKLHINGTAVVREEIDGSDNGCRIAGSAVSYVETLPNGVSYQTRECAGDFGQLDNVGPYRVPPEHYFMLGDNRDQSQDSRVISQVGYIHEDYIIGRAKISKESKTEL